MPHNQNTKTVYLSIIQTRLQRYKKRAAPVTPYLRENREFDIYQDSTPYNSVCRYTHIMAKNSQNLVRLRGYTIFVETKNHVMKHARTLAVMLAAAATLSYATAQEKSDDTPLNTPARYLFPDDYMADPSAHVFEGKLYIYPSHDWESGVTDPTDGNHFNMRDYHVFSTKDPEKGKVTDHGVVLSLEEIPWAGRQLWACDVAEKDGKYYMYFPAKDKNDIFRIGVAVADKPYGPFKPQPHPMRGSYSIDPAVLEDNGSYYIYFGGLQGGQLQRFRNNKAIECGTIPGDNEEALPARVARLSDDMLEFAEEPRPVVILDAEGNPLKNGDPHRFFEAAWVHKYNGKYYFSYSTGTTHMLCYAIGDNPYGPFTYQGVILTPVVGWTTHHSICQYKGKWYLFFHDSTPSGGHSHLRSMKVCELQYNPDGTIRTIAGEPR